MIFFPLLGYEQSVAEALMLSEAPILPLYYLPCRSLRHPAVKGWHDNLLDLHPLKFAYLEN